ncbi:hypothetical protein D9615_004049 [Tricholomella constricta]|uniref:JmjC domain-containing protein n=1 Tax=Tricholomella constricta TaxID=117010 RepID=A0A8H5HD86_9AGAR|nr:hypothetical protein D9615_004049 [Tricholomella constricta]
MGIEQQRKKLMAARPIWGERRDIHHVPEPHQNPASGQCNCLAASSPISSNASRLDVSSIRDMNNVIEPLSPSPVIRISTYGWSLESILCTGKQFRPIPRLSASGSTTTMKEITKYERGGLPLIIEGFHKDPKWPRDKFRPEWLEAHGPEDISVRNVHNWNDSKVPLSDFIAKSRASPKFASAEEQERLYGKDAECPDEWNEWLHTSKVIPSALTPEQPENLLLSDVETLMCYIGIGDTFTPCHKDLCASSGQNLMCYTEKDGSSFWFMTKSSDAPEASRYFQKLKQELDHETHVITVAQLANAPFTVFVGEQQLGDLVLVPPRSCHQVVNYGGITIKTSWSRMTLEGLEAAYYHELPIYQRVCRPEIYRVKSTIYHTLRQRTADLEKIHRNDIHRRSLLIDSRHTDLTKGMKALLKLFDDILLEEYSSSHKKMYCLSSASSSPAASQSSADTSSDDAKGIDLHCDFCGADVFQSFFECQKCVSPEVSGYPNVEHGDGFVVCACRPFDELLFCRNKAAQKLSAFTNATYSPLTTSSLSSARGTFRAACQLNQMRKEKVKETKVCSFPIAGEMSHTVLYSSALTCKKCHHSKCFTHILMLHNIHSADALLLHSSDSSHEEHHNHHLTSKGKFEEGRDAFLYSQKQGTKPDISQQRVYLALEYATCRPVNSNFMSLGWYDTYAQIVQDEETDGNMSQNVSTSDLAVSTSQRPSESHASYPSNSATTTSKTPLPESSTTEIPIPTSRKRKRILMDYIGVPDPAHISRQSSRSTSRVADAASVNTSEESITSTQSVSNEPLTTISSTVDVEAADTEQDPDVMQTDTNGTLTATIDEAQAQASSVTTRSPTTISTEIFHANCAITSVTSSTQLPKRKQLRRTTHSALIPSPDPSSTTLETPMSERRQGAGVTSDITTSGSENVKGAKNSRLEVFSSAPSRSSSPVENTIERSSKQGPLDYTNTLRNLRFKKFTRSARRVSPARASYQSSSSSSAYPISTASEGLPHAFNRAPTGDYRSVDTTRVNPTNTAPGNPDTQPSATPKTDVLHDQLKSLSEVVSQLSDEVKLMRQTPPTPVQQFPVIQTAAFSDFVLTMAARMLGTAGPSFSLPHANAHWPQFQMPASYVEQPTYPMPPSPRAEHGYYAPYPPSPPARWERGHWGISDWERSYEVPRTDAGPSSRPSQSQSYSYYSRPRQESYGDDRRDHPVIYERDMDVADIGSSRPHRFSPATAPERRSSTHQVNKHDRLYSRPPTDKRLNRNQIIKSNFVRRSKFSNESRPKEASSRSTLTLDLRSPVTNQRKESSVRKDSPQKEPSPGDFAPQASPRRDPVPPPTSTLSNERDSSRNISLHRETAHRDLTSQGTGFRPPPPPSPTVNRSESISQNLPQLQPLVQRIPIPTGYEVHTGRPEGPRDARTRGQTPVEGLSPMLLSTMDGPSLHQLPFDVRSESSMNLEARGGRSGAQTPFGVRSEPSMNWEDDYEQEDVVISHNDTVPRKPPPEPENARSLAYIDPTANPWL